MHFHVRVFWYAQKRGGVVLFPFLLSLALPKQILHVMGKPINARSIAALQITSRKALLQEATYRNYFSFQTEIATRYAIACFFVDSTLELFSGSSRKLISDDVTAIKHRA